jgi:hypothetical protein
MMHHPFPSSTNTYIWFHIDEIDVEFAFISLSRQILSFFLYKKKERHSKMKGGSAFHQKKL